MILVAKGRIMRFVKGVILAAFVFGSLRLQAQFKKLVMDDYVYEEGIQTVQLYLQTEEQNAQFSAPVLALGQETPLQLDFDELGSNAKSYYVRVVHCNQDWTQSMLMESEYLKEFINDFLITTYNLSFNTRTKYVHYSAKIPQVKVSGNYVVMVFRNNSPEDVVLTKRFIVYANKVSITPNVRISIGVEERFTHQQVDFSINYSSYPYIYTPAQEVYVVLRQNNRWDNAITNLKPLYINQSDRTLDYNFFNLENNFPGSNEFRMFDIRRIRSNALNVDNIDIKTNEINVYLMQDKSRNGKNYSFQFDADGRFVVYNNEIGGNFGDPDYVNVTFQLKTSEMPYGNVYVLGWFNNFKPDEKYRLNYDADSDTYKAKVFMKQGYYNYIYGVKNMKEPKADEVALEGSYFQTQNRYEIIVYHRPIGARADAIIGYYYINYNGTN